MSLCHLRARFARGTAPSHETRPAPEVPGETEPCALGGSAPSLLPDVNGAEAGQRRVKAARTRLRGNPVACKTWELFIRKIQRGRYVVSLVQ